MPTDQQQFRVVSVGYRSGPIIWLGGEGTVEATVPMTNHEAIELARQLLNAVNLPDPE